MQNAELTLSYGEGGPLAVGEVAMQNAECKGRGGACSSRKNAKCKMRNYGMKNAQTVGEGLAPPENVKLGSLREGAGTEGD